MWSKCVRGTKHVRGTFLDKTAKCLDNGIGRGSILQLKA